MPAARQPSVRAVPEEPNVALRPTDDGEGQEVVLAFPYDGHLVAAVRTLPGRRFDWDLREWSAPADDWVAAQARRDPALPSRADPDRGVRRVARQRPSSAGSATCARRATTAAAGARSTRSPARCPRRCASGAMELDGRGWCR